MNSSYQAAGFTLVEALVSVAILSIGFAGLYASIGASVTTLNQSSMRGQLDYLSQTILNDLAADVDHLVDYQRLINDQLEPLDLILDSSCSGATIACDNRIRWSEQLLEVLGADGVASLQIHPVCAPGWSGSCPDFSTSIAARRSAVLTVNVTVGRGVYNARRIIDVRES